MTMETWKAEFYPVPADTPMSDKEALEFSIQKWKGYRKENLDKHGLEVDTCYANTIRQFELSDKGTLFNTPMYKLVNEFTFDASTCPLCVKHFCNVEGCGTCPITKLTGRPCYRSYDSAYNQLATYGDPEPMIVLLEKTLKLLIEKGTADG